MLLCACGQLEHRRQRQRAVDACGGDGGGARGDLAALRPHPLPLRAASTGAHALRAGAPPD
eukprot:2338516-Pleurochrysis_carterae.AAC.1